MYYYEDVRFLLVVKVRTHVPDILVSMNPYPRFAETHPETVMIDNLTSPQSVGNTLDFTFEVLTRCEIVITQYLTLRGVLSDFREHRVLTCTVNDPYEVLTSCICLRSQYRLPSTGLRDRFLGCSNDGDTDSHVLIRSGRLKRTQTHSCVFALFLVCTQPPDQCRSVVLQSGSTSSKTFRLTLVACGSSTSRDAMHQINASDALKSQDCLVQLRWTPRTT